MNSEQAVYRRVVRRELHSSRAGAAIALAVILILLLAALGAVCVLLVVHAPAVSGLREGLSDAVRLGAGFRYPVLAGGAVVAALGVLLIVLGIAPGRRARRRIPFERAAVIADDTVIANALAARATSAAGVTPGQLRVVLGRRRATARLVPTSGSIVDTATVEEALAHDAAVYGLARAPRLVVAEHGAVG